MVFNYYWIQPSITITLYHMVFNTHPVENGSQHWIYVIHTPDAHMVLESAKDVDLILFLWQAVEGTQWVSFAQVNQHLGEENLQNASGKIIVYNIHTCQCIYIIYIYT